MTKEDNKCAMCQGSGRVLEQQSCVYCNGTGEWNSAAQSYVNNHICQCINWDRKNCPVCKKKCHHDTTFNPKQTIDSGPGGLGNSRGTDSSPDMPDIIA